MRAQAFANVPQEPRAHRSDQPYRIVLEDGNISWRCQAFLRLLFLHLLVHDTLASRNPVRKQQGQKYEADSHADPIIHRHNAGLVTVALVRAPKRKEEEHHVAEILSHSLAGEGQQDVSSSLQSGLLRRKRALACN